MYGVSVFVIIFSLPTSFGAMGKTVITKTCLDNFDPLKLHICTVKLGFTWGIHYFTYFARKHR